MTHFILTRQEIFDIEPIMCVLWIDPQHVCSCMGIVFSQQSSGKVPTVVSTRKTISRPCNLLTGHYFRVSWAGWELKRLNEGGKVRGVALQPGLRLAYYCKPAWEDVFNRQFRILWLVCCLLDNAAQFPFPQVFFYYLNWILSVTLRETLFAFT